MRKVICSIVCALLLVSCGEYNKILKSTDYELKYDYAKKAFERKKYMQAATLLEELVAIFKGTDRAEESLYLLARSYYLNKDYITSEIYYANDRKDAAGIGFDDDFIYKELELKPAERHKPSEIFLPEEAKRAFEMWKEKDDKREY